MSGSVGGSSENEWGSDFEDSSDTRTTARQDMVGISKEIIHINSISNLFRLLQVQPQGEKSLLTKIE